MNRKLTESEIRERRADYTYNQYDHGGSRIHIDGESGDRQLLVDTYYNEHFAKAINEFTRMYFGIPEGKSINPDQQTDFNEYLKAARSKFVLRILSMETLCFKYSSLKVAAEDILIAFDQVVEKYVGLFKSIK